MKYIRKNYIGDDEQVRRINSKVGKADMLIILGDIGDVSYIKKLRGYKVLITGNHDKGPSAYKEITTYTTKRLDEKTVQSLGLQNWTESDLFKKGYIHNLNLVTNTLEFSRIIASSNGLFDEVYSGPVALNDKILLSHEPIDIKLAGNVSGKSFMFNIHGHDHSGKLSDMYHLNVCAELVDYTPVSLQSLIKQGILSNIDTIHRLTIDGATAKKQLNLEIKEEVVK